MCECEREREIEAEYFLFANVLSFLYQKIVCVSIHRLVHVNCSSSNKLSQKYSSSGSSELDRLLLALQVFLSLSPSYLRERKREKAK